jgi:hypothetical protein
MNATVAVTHVHYVPFPYNDGNRNDYGLGIDSSINSKVIHNNNHEHKPSCVAEERSIEVLGMKDIVVKQTR